MAAFIVHKQKKDSLRGVACNTSGFELVSSDKDYQVSCAKCLKEMGMMQNKVSTFENSKTLSQSEKIARGRSGTNK